MTKQDILDYFKDIDFMCNHAGMYDDLSTMLDRLLENRPEVVRCKDCIHWDDDDCEIGNNPQMFADDWFCADGERR